MKHFKLLSLVVLVFCFSLSSSAQESANLSAEVMKKMDANKTAGKNVYTGIDRHMVFTFHGVNSAEDFMKLKSLLTEKLSISSAIYDKTTGKVSLVVNASKKPEDVKGALKESTFEISQFLEEKVALSKK